MQKVDAVFEGGGVKGTAFIGAITVTEKNGYQFDHLAGTSAGAIVAALLAAGYTALELREILNSVDYRRFLDKRWLSYIPLIGSALTALFYQGLYQGNALEKWLEELLADKGVYTFADLIHPLHATNPQYRYRLRVIASNLSRGTILALPQDIAYYGIDPDDLSVARALRISLGLPFFFEPVILKDSFGDPNHIVDGGVLSKFPLTIFQEQQGDHPWPTLGYKLVEPINTRGMRIRGPIAFLKALITTLLQAQENFHIPDSNFTKTIPIPTLGVEPTDFDLSLEKREALYRSGEEAAEKFFATHQPETEPLILPPV